MSAQTEQQEAAHTLETEFAVFVATCSANRMLRAIADLARAWDAALAALGQRTES